MALNTLKRATVLLLVKAFERENSTNIMPCSGHKTFHRSTMFDDNKVYLCYNTNLVDCKGNPITHVVSMPVSEVL